MSYRSSNTDGASETQSDERAEDEFSDEDIERTISEIKSELRQRDYDDLDPEQYTE